MNNRSLFLMILVIFLTAGAILLINYDMSDDSGGMVTEATAQSQNG